VTPYLRISPSWRFNTSENFRQRAILLLLLLYAYASFLIRYIRAIPEFRTNLFTQARAFYSAVALRFVCNLNARFIRSYFLVLLCHFYWILMVREIRSFYLNQKSSLPNLDNLRPDWEPVRQMLFAGWAQYGDVCVDAAFVTLWTLREFCSKSTTMISICTSSLISRRRRRSRRASVSRRRETWPPKAVRPRALQDERPARRRVESAAIRLRLSRHRTPSCPGRYITPPYSRRSRCQRTNALRRFYQTCF